MNYFRPGYKFTFTAGQNTFAQIEPIRFRFKCIAELKANRGN